MNLQAAGKAHTFPSEKYENMFYTKKETDLAISQWIGDKLSLYNNYYGNKYDQVYRLIERQVEEKHADFVVIDNIMSLDLDTSKRDKWDAQTQFIWQLKKLAVMSFSHVLFVAHPRKAVGFLRLDDVSGSADLANLTDNAFIIHRNNADFKRLSKDMFKWKDDHVAFTGTNVIEIAKDRDMGTQDVFIPLWYEPETKRLKNSEAESITYGWLPDEFEAVDLDDIPF